MPQVKFNPHFAYPKIKGTKSNPLKEKDIALAAKNIQTTLLGVKADAYEKGLDVTLINKLKEMTGLSIIAKKVEIPSVKKVRAHYAEHVNKPFYPNLEKYITRDNFGLFVFKGENAVKKVRKACMELRNTFAPGSKNENLLHSSDSKIAAQKEIINWFGAPIAKHKKLEKLNYRAIA